jgi:cell division protein FtsW
VAAVNNIGANRARHETGGNEQIVARKLKTDKMLFLATLLLVCVGIVMVYSATTYLVVNDWDERYRFVTRQTLWAILGVAGLAMAMRIDYRLYRNDAFIYGLIGAIGVMLVAVLFRTAKNGASRWLGVGSLGIQPSEFAKIICIFFTALILERRMHRIDEVKYSLLPIGLVAGGLMVLIAIEPDMGTAVCLLLVVLAMVFTAGLGYRYLFGAFVVGVPALLLYAISADYRLQRFIAFFSGESETSGHGYQAYQSKLAIGVGGIFGKGLTHGEQKNSWVPFPHTDFIYAVIGEELGIIGATAVLLCFCVIAWRGVRIALRAEDPFGAFIAIGLTTMICVQALINISVVLSLMPTKGIPLPLVSFGGSSLLVSLIGIGVLLNISQHSRTVEA